MEKGRGGPFGPPRRPPAAVTGVTAGKGGPRCGQDFCVRENRAHEPTTESEMDRRDGSDRGRVGTVASRTSECDDAGDRTARGTGDGATGRIGDVRASDGTGGKRARGGGALPKVWRGDDPARVSAAPVESGA